MRQTVGQMTTLSPYRFAVASHAGGVRDKPLVQKECVTNNNNVRVGGSLSRDWGGGGGGAPGKRGGNGVDLF